MEGENEKKNEITILSNVKVANTYEIPLNSPSKPTLLDKSDSHPMLMLFEPLNTDDSTSQMASTSSIHLNCAHTVAFPDPLPHSQKFKLVLAYDDSTLRVIETDL